MRLHDISSQAIVPLLDLQPGHSYLDLCAAPGNKTMQALETPLALAIACDISPQRIRQIPKLCPRVVLDAARPMPFGRRFDRIFIDAPCSGTGTLARNPEIKWRVQEQDFDRFRTRQVAMLGEALRLLAPGGKLLYATCSLEREENEDVICEALVAWTRFRRHRQMWRIPGREAGDGFYAALLQESP
jgi:16S rRNA (cytosine967-C5)-methyltransferase